MTRSVADSLRLVASLAPESITMLAPIADDRTIGFSPYEVPVIDYSDPSGITEKTVTLFF